MLTRHIRESLQVTPGPFPDFWVGPGDEASLMWVSIGLVQAFNHMTEGAYPHTTYLFPLQVTLLHDIGKGPLARVGSLPTCREEGMIEKQTVSSEH